MAITSSNGPANKKKDPLNESTVYQFRDSLVLYHLYKLGVRAYVSSSYNAVISDFESTLDMNIFYRQLIRAKAAPRALARYRAKAAVTRYARSFPLTGCVTRTAKEQIKNTNDYPALER